MYHLGEDHYGTWLWAPDGSKARRGDEPAVTFGGCHVKLITADQWWTAIWNDGPRQGQRDELFVDIATPAEWSDDTVRMIDLDLDIGRWHDGRVSVLDEDEFAEHAETLAYPDHIVDRARTTTARLYLEVLRRSEPFDEVGAGWLQRACALDRPPL